MFTPRAGSEESELGISPLLRPHRWENHLAGLQCFRRMRHCPGLAGTQHCVGGPYYYKSPHQPGAAATEASMQTDLNPQGSRPFTSGEQERQRLRTPFAPISATQSTRACVSLPGDGTSHEAAHTWRWHESRSCTLLREKSMLYRLAQAGHSGSHL